LEVDDAGGGVLVVEVVPHGPPAADVRLDGDVGHEPLAEALGFHERGVDVVRFAADGEFRAEGVLPREVALRGGLAAFDVVDEVGDGQRPERAEDRERGVVGDGVRVQRDVALRQRDHRGAVLFGQCEPDGGGDAVEAPLEAQVVVVDVQEALAGRLAVRRVPAPEREGVRQVRLGALGEPHLECGGVGERGANGGERSRGPGTDRHLVRHMESLVRKRLFCQ
jgi:hypothetical protein